MTQIDLDEVLIKLCELVVQGQETDPEQFGMVAACIISPNGDKVGRVNYKLGNDRVHAERAAINAYEQNYGIVTPDCICVTTLSPCCNAMHDRFGDSCSDLLANKGITQVYAGYRDPTQTDSEFVVTHNTKLQELCKRLADTFLKENFANGHHPEDKGDSRRHGIKKHSTLSDLDKIVHSKNASPRKKQLAHWQANMRRGRAK